MKLKIDETQGSKVDLIPFLYYVTDTRSNLRRTARRVASFAGLYLLMSAARKPVAERLRIDQADAQAVAALETCHSEWLAA
eukprot:CAMPEP_0183355718 /NCGR_PEP_ID=MMETSP0164_2-20130417/41525_1 /TAXON_ID=221442 /ORGANISM="Coccolithus pelagicus ssp braarudi, Strain PLY182g" /LENGTH=80 /DNA_ID=CAMNT_0025528903 /DNA_START=212 /DNA_END=454 /DNA_ORIENTATION=+